MMSLTMPEATALSNMIDAHLPKGSPYAWVLILQPLSEEADMSKRETISNLSPEMSAALIAMTAEDTTTYVEELAGKS